jgi:hypothetical protein
MTSDQAVAMLAKLDVMSTFLTTYQNWFCWGAALLFFIFGLNMGWKIGN